MCPISLSMWTTPDCSRSAKNEGKLIVRRSSIVGSILNANVFLLLLGYGPVSPPAFRWLVVFRHDEQAHKVNLITNSWSGWVGLIPPFPTVVP